MPSMHMELRVWIGSVQRVISGVSVNTTSQEVIVALAQATGKTGRFTLVEKWRDYEQTLTPADCPLMVAQKFGDYAHEVQFILRQTGEASSAQSRRLAEAKSPKPQRRQTRIKKSMSFSGGAQSTTPPSRSPKLQNPLHGGIQEEDIQSDPTYVTPQPRVNVPQPHPSAHPSTAHRPNYATDDQKQARSESKLPVPEVRERKHRQSPSVSQQVTESQHKQHHQEKQRPRRRSGERESRSRQERQQQKEREARLREAYELQQTLANHERRLEDEKRKLNNVDREISNVTIEEEKKWGTLYDCRDEISRSLHTVQRLEVDLDSCDEVLLSEELNVLLRKQEELDEEMNELRVQLTDCDSHILTEHQQTKSLASELDDLEKDNADIDKEIKGTENEMEKLQSRVEEKKRFLMEAEDGYMSACDDLKEADNSLEKRKQMLVELERELREYNLKTFINTGFIDKTVSAES